MCRHNPNARTSRAFRYARPWHLAKISYVITLFGIVTSQQAHEQTEELSKRARRVLSFFAALNRTGKAGFLGTACTLDQLSDAIKRATGEPCGRSTLCEALKELRAAGFLASSRWTPEGATAVDISKPWQAPDYRTLTIRIWSLTPESIALWSRSRGRSAGAHSSLHVQKPTASDLVPDNSVNTEINTGSSRSGVRYNDASDLKRDNKVLSSDNCTTRAVVDGQRPRGPLEHKHPVAANRGEKSRYERGTESRSIGVSCPPPPKPKRNDPVTWEHCRNLLLANVWFALVTTPGAQADLLYNRARSETDRFEWPRGWPTCTNWDYWLKHWPRWRWKDRRKTVKDVILPALKTPVRAFSIYDAGQTEQKTSPGSGSRQPELRCAEKPPNKVSAGGSSPRGITEHAAMSFDGLSEQWRDIARKMGIEQK